MKTVLTIHKVTKKGKVRLRGMNEDGVLIEMTWDYGDGTYVADEVGQEYEVEIARAA